MSSRCEVYTVGEDGYEKQLGGLYWQCKKLWLSITPTVGATTGGHIFIVASSTYSRGRIFYHSNPIKIYPGYSFLRDKFAFKLFAYCCFLIKIWAPNNPFLLHKHFNPREINNILYYNYYIKQMKSALDTGLNEIVPTDKEL